MKVHGVTDIVVVDPNARFCTEAPLDCRLQAIQEAVDPSTVVPVRVTEKDVAFIAGDIGHSEISKNSDNSSPGAFSDVN